MRSSHPSFPEKKDFLSLVIICMASQAIRDRIDLLDDLVLDFHVALVTFDFTLENMRVVHEVCIIVFIQPISFPVAFVAVFPGNLTISDYGVAVAFITIITVAENRRMIES
jgi:hypothetical protein